MRLTGSWPQHGESDDDDDEEEGDDDGEESGDSGGSNYHSTDNDDGDDNDGDGDGGKKAHGDASQFEDGGSLDSTLPLPPLVDGVPDPRADSAPTEIADDDDDDDDDGDDGIDLPRKRSKKTQVTLTGEHLTESDDSAPKEDSVEETDSDRMLLKLEDQLLAETKAKYYS